MTSEEKNSYGQVLRSSSIIGGAQIINYLISMLKTKLVAVMLGPSGVGLVGLYVSATNFVGTFTGLGLANSGVREVAEAHGSGDDERISRTIHTLQRACLVTGIISWLVTALLAYPLSNWIFHSSEHILAIAILGSTLLLAAISRGQSALLQGTRRIGDLARLNVLGAIAGTILAIGLYAWLGKKGIVPVLITTAAVNLGFSWWFSRRIKTTQIAQSWTETFANSKRLVNVGLAFMYGALLSSFVDLAIRSLINNKLGLDFNGIYQSAWNISGMFASFILDAMGTDFYPRLTAVAHDNEQVNRLVNEQIEIGLLLALPGLLASVVFAPILMSLFYSVKFLQGAELLPWFVVGVLVQVIIFPIGMIMRAKGAVRWIYLGQTESNMIHLLLCTLLIPRYGLLGTCYAFISYIVIHGIVVSIIAARLSGFRWGRQEIKLITATLLFVFLACSLRGVPNKYFSLCLGSLLVATGCIFSFQGVVLRLDSKHRLVVMARKIPLLRNIYDQKVSKHFNQ